MKKIVTKINKFMRQYFPYEETPGSLADFIRQYPESMIDWFTGALDCFEPDEKGYQECLEIIDILQRGEKKMINKKIYEEWKDQPILHDEDLWGGKYKTYGEMWSGEGYVIER